MKHVKLLTLAAATVVVALIAVGCGQAAQPAATAPAAAPAATQTAAAPAEKATPAYVGEKTCLQCHQKTNFDKTPHVNSFKPLSAYQLEKPAGTVTVYDGAANNAKSTTVDLSKALGVQMDTYVVVEIPKEAGFAKRFYRVGHISKAADGKWEIAAASKVTGKEDWSAGEYTCLDCHSPAMGKAGTPDLTVTCEACHGPGGDHVKATTPEQKAATITVPDTQTCLKCHTSNPTKDAATGAIITNNHQGTRDWALSKHGNSGQINGCLTCHNVHGVNANGKLLRKDNPNDICMTCHADKKYDVNTIMFKNPSDPHGHTSADHSFTAVPLSAMKVNDKTKNMEITDQAALDAIKKKFPDLFK